MCDISAFQTLGIYILPERYHARPERSQIEDSSIPIDALILALTLIQKKYGACRVLPSAWAYRNDPCVDCLHVRKNPINQQIIVVTDFYDLRRFPTGEDWKNYYHQPEVEVVDLRKMHGDKNG